MQLDNIPMIINFSMGRPYRTKVFVHIPTGLLFRASDIDSLNYGTVINALEFEELPGTERIEEYE